MRLLRAPLPEYSRGLIEPQTLAAAGCRRETYLWVKEDAVPAEARRLVDELLALSAADQPAVALTLGFEFDRRRLTADELLRRLILAAFLHELGAKDIFASPVAYQGRARWDLYSPDLEMLVALNHLIEETDAVQHLTHQHARAVLWAPPAARPASGWPVLRYTALAPWPPKRNWFDEVVQQNERQSVEKRVLQVSARGVEDRLPAVRALVARIHAALAEGEYLTENEALTENDALPRNQAPTENEPLTDNDALTENEEA